MAAGLIPMTTSGSPATPAVTATPQQPPHPPAAPQPPQLPPPPPSPYVHFMSQYHQAGLIPPGLSAAMAAAAASVTPSPIALMAVAALTSGSAIGAEAGGSGKKPPVL